MKPEQQRIAIAEACGIQDARWTPDGLVRNKFAGWVGPDDNTGRLVTVPDYLNDLNAMHEAEKVLTNAQRRYYAEALIAVHPLHYDPREKRFGTEMEDDTAMKLFLMVNMTAAQRAEAFLHTIGKWTAAPSAPAPVSTITHPTKGAKPCLHKSGFYQFEGDTFCRDCDTVEEDC